MFLEKKGLSRPPPVTALSVLSFPQPPFDPLLALSVSFCSSFYPTSLLLHPISPSSFYPITPLLLYPPLLMSLPTSLYPPKLSRRCSSHITSLHYPPLLYPSHLPPLPISPPTLLPPPLPLLPHLLTRPSFIHPSSLLLHHLPPHILPAQALKEMLRENREEYHALDAAQGRSSHVRG